ncbi:hypothetical protein SteCoe_30750 [Stentor coeruleus]|uniref:Cyclic nucleotide-binding domain-containing protein n=1 Tax=Stentor coeruleus TaxID=5963 RepID=A0A1R2B2V9_9CILI|nr:hypothetical protein SteCoe_30750 [Stentor coeruleus]
MDRSKTFRKRTDIEKISREAIAKVRWERIRNLKNLEFIIDVAHSAAEERNVSRFNSNFFSKFSENDELHLPWYIILPESKIKSLFDLLVSFLYLYFAFVIPFRIGFYTQSTNEELIPHETVFEAILLIDILLNFFCAYYENSVLIYDLRLIAKKYLLNRFILDTIAIPPFYVLNANLYWLKISRVLRVNLFLRWIENSTLTKNFINDTLLKDQYTKDLFFKLLYFVQAVLITCHCIACIWYYITTLNFDTPDKTWLLGAEYPTTDLYVRSLYWTAVTFSSVGYGDITPKNNGEYIYAMCIEFVGIMFFAYLMGNVSNYLSNFQLTDETANERERELERWLLMLDGFRHDKTMPQQLTTKIRDYFHGCWSKDNSYICSSDFMLKLPYALREELKEFLFSDVVKKFSIFFEGMSKHLVYSLASLMKHKWVKSFETMIVKGTKSTEIYFINTGSVMVGKKEIGYVTKLLSGSYFGEYSLFKVPYDFDFTAEGETSVFYFPIIDFKTWIKKCEFNYYSFALLSYKRHLYFTKEFDKTYNTTDDNEAFQDERIEEEVFNENLNHEEEEEFNILLERVKEPEPTGCTPEEKEELLNKIKAQAKEIEKLQKMYESDIKKIISAVELMTNGKEQAAYELLTEI